tara:strand:- start:1834 stop:2115 length:282 start_codon:yes stop_codon:yes gene_type:complete
MDDNELKRIKDQIFEEIMKGKGMATARILQRNKGISLDVAKEVVEKTHLLEWRSVVGPNGGRPSIVFFQRVWAGRIVDEESVPWLLEQLKSRN